jgi:hypothetical protein
MVAFSPGDASANKRKFCQFNFKLHYPPGWAFTVVSNDYSGYIGIDGGLTAEVVSSYYYSGHSTGRSDVCCLLLAFALAFGAWIIISWLY